MFASVLFNDINKAAFDVMKDGYSFDQKTSLKTSCCGYNMSLEAKNFTSSLSGKFAVDFKPFTYLAVKKLSIENTGAAVFDLDIPNFVRGTTFMFRSQGDAFTHDVKKATCGLKYMSECFSGDVNFDVLSQKINSSAVLAHNNFMIGCKVEGTKDAVTSFDAALAFCYKECVLSAASINNHTAIDAAVYAKPFKNVKVGADCIFSLTESKNPLIAFGMCMNPTMSSELRTKVGSDGKLYGYYKTTISKNISLAVTGAVDYNNMFSGSHKIGMAVEMRI